VSLNSASPPMFIRKANVRPTSRLEDALSRSMVGDVRAGPSDIEVRKSTIRLASVVQRKVARLIRLIAMKFVGNAIVVRSTVGRFP
jgi:hypothetical protein